MIFKYAQEQAGSKLPPSITADADTLKLSDPMANLVIATAKPNLIIPASTDLAIEKVQEISLIKALLFHFSKKHNDKF